MDDFTLSVILSALIVVVYTFLASVAINHETDADEDWHSAVDSCPLGYAMPEQIPTAPTRIAYCTLPTCRWAGSLDDAIVISAVAFCPNCSCACESDEPCDEPIILHATGKFDPLADTR